MDNKPLGGTLALQPVVPVQLIPHNPLSLSPSLSVHVCVGWGGGESVCGYNWIGGGVG